MTSSHLLILELMTEANLVIVQAHKPSLLETNDSMSIELAEFLARGAIMIRIETFYSDDHSQTAKDLTFYSDEAKGANVHVVMPVNMSFLQLQKSYMLAHEAIGTIISITKINNMLAYMWSSDDCR